MKKEIVLITGGSGLIAPYVARALQDNYDIRFFTRTPKQANEYAWDPVNQSLDEAALEGISYIVHLSGSRFTDGTPLTDERKKLIWDTRVGASELLLSKLKEKNITLKAFISSSALGCYAFNDQALAIDENGNRANNYENELVIGWERAADQFKQDGVAQRVVKLRVTLVLGKEGHFFQSLLRQLNNNPTSFANSEGQNYFPWIHAKDMGAMFAYGVKNQQIDGVFNAAAPQRTTQQAAQKLMYYLQQGNKQAFEQLDASFAGQYLSSDKIINAGYQFSYPDIKSALLDLMK